MIEFNQFEWVYILHHINSLSSFYSQAILHVLFFPPISLQQMKCKREAGKEAAVIKKIEEKDTEIQT